VAFGGPEAQPAGCMDVARAPRIRARRQLAAETDSGLAPDRAGPGHVSQPRAGDDAVAVPRGGSAEASPVTRSSLLLPDKQRGREHRCYIYGDTITGCNLRDYVEVETTTPEFTEDKQTCTN
jgi:hypothetical protein